MAFERQRQWIWERYNQRPVRRITKSLLLVTVFIGVFFSFLFPGQLSLDQSVLYILLIIFVLLEFIETKVYDIENLVATRTNLFPTTDSAYDFYSEQDLNETDDSRLYMLNYGGISPSTRKLIQCAEDAECEIYLLLKDPRKHSIISDNQLNSVCQSIENLFMLQESISLNIRFYENQASLNGFKLGDSYIGVGWFTFDERSGRPNKVWGHNNPMITYTSRNPNEFAMINKWFMDVFHRIWEQAETLEAVSRSDETPTRLEEWNDSTEKARWIGDVSLEHPERKKTLFPDYGIFDQMASYAERQRRT